MLSVESRIAVLPVRHPLLSVESRVLPNVTSSDKIGGVARVGGVANGQQLVFLILPGPVPERVSVVGHPIANSPQAVIWLYTDFYRFLHLVSVWVMLCWYVFRSFGTVNLASW